MLSGYQFIAGGLILSLLGLLMGGRLQRISLAAVGILVYLAIVSAVAYSLWGMLLKYNPISRVAVFGFMNPVFGVLLSALLLKKMIRHLACLESRHYYWSAWVSILSTGGKRHRNRERVIW